MENSGNDENELKESTEQKEVDEDFVKESNELFQNLFIESKVIFNYLKIIKNYLNKINSKFCFFFCVKCITASLSLPGKS